MRHALCDRIALHADQLFRLLSTSCERPSDCRTAERRDEKAMMVMGNSGLRQACEPIARFSFCHAMPLVMAMSFRGEWGERNWWGHNHAQTMEPILNALRIPFRFISKLTEIKPAIRKAYYHADSSNWPVAMVFTGELSRCLPMKRFDAIKAISDVITPDDLVTTSIGQTWDDWWNLKPANNTFFTGILGSVSSTALGLAVSLPHRRIVSH